jgi:hypothetical protein
MAKNNPPMPLLDVFVLFLVREGINTLYRLKHDAGISIGAAAPSLRRLEKQYIARRTKGPKGKELLGTRGQRNYQLNLFAGKFFESDWLATFETKLPTDTESIARLVALAEAGSRPDVATAALSHAIKERRKRAGRPAPIAGRSSLATRYRIILQACEAARLKAEATVLKKILAGLQ